MRIAHVVHSYFPRIGGIERAVQYLVEEQVKLGNDVMEYPRTMALLVLGRR
jgi:hypothetical protein